MAQTSLDVSKFADSRWWLVQGMGTGLGAELGAAGREQPTVTEQRNICPRISVQRAVKQKPLEGHMTPKWLLVDAMPSCCLQLELEVGEGLSGTGT